MSIPTFDPAGDDPRAATDAQRADGPVARTPEGTWVVLGHAEAAEVAGDAQRYSSAVSRFLQVPNGLDGEEHTAFRAVIDPFFAPEEMSALEPQLREVARDLVGQALAEADDGTEVNAVSDLGAVYAVRAQTRWLGWPDELEDTLLEWMRDNHEASRSGELSRTAAVAERFDTIIRSVVEPRRELREDAPDDVTTKLLRTTVAAPGADGEPARERPLRDEEIVSILRNWTGGDLSSIALCTGVLLEGISRLPQLAERLRSGTFAEASAIVDELLRIDDPFVSNRRKATCPVTLAGRHIEAGDRLIIHWTSANRDERRFPDPDHVDPEGNAPHNLVWGTGKHVCPGRPLATLELVVLLQELLAAAEVEPARTAGARSVAPTGGWSEAPVVLKPRR